MENDQYIEDDLRPAFNDFERVRITDKTDFIAFSRLSVADIESGSLAELTKKLNSKKTISASERFEILIQIFFDRFSEELQINDIMLDQIKQTFPILNERADLLNPISVILGFFVVVGGNIDMNKITYLFSHFQPFFDEGILYQDVIKYARMWIAL